jgi:hypothetical protein
MQSDSEIAVERVQSEAASALLSIQSYRDIGPAYFDRFRASVTAALTFFEGEDRVPPALIEELEASAQILRNEATVFPGRALACEEMADWLVEQRALFQRQ